MSENKYVVPEDGLKAAQREALGGEFPVMDFMRRGVEAFIRWQSENPPVPSLLDISSNLKPEGQQIAINESIEWIRRMYLAPEPKVDRVDFYIKTSDGQFVPWKPTEEQTLISPDFFRLPIRCLDCGSYFKGDACPCKKKTQPEAPDAIKDLLCDEVPHTGPYADVHNAQIIESFLRGQKSGAK